MGTKDFTTFSAKSVTDRKIVYVRSLQSFTLEEAQPLMSFDPLSKNFTYWHFICKGRSFLYNQVIFYLQITFFVCKEATSVALCRLDEWLVL